MKKLVVFILALGMTLSLVACGGGVDKKAATEAFNTANTQFTEIVTVVNDNLDKLDEETLGIFHSISDSMAGYKEELESEDLTQERADEIETLLKDVPEALTQIKAGVDMILGAQ